MKPKDIFNLAVRILGLIFAYLTVRTLAGIWYAPGTIAVVLTGAVYGGAAWWFIGGARSLTNRAYPESQTESKTDLSSGSEAKA